MKEGDFIVGIGDKDVKWAPHEEVVALIKASGNNLNLRIVTPVDKRHTAIGKVLTCADRIDLLGPIQMLYLMGIIYIGASLCQTVRCNTKEY